LAEVCALMSALLVNTVSLVSTVKPIFFVWPLFREFREINGCEYAILVYYLVQQAKMPTLGVPQ